MKKTPTLVGRAFCALISTLALTATSAYAHSPVSSEEAGELHQLVNRANLVFRGRVAKVEYRNSEATEDEPGLPHAFVTYRMSNVLRGEKTEDLFTIRFLGGPDGRGDFFEISGVPMFQEGEENILFVKGNGEEGCPLVYCEWGRFRVHQGGVFNTHGSPIRAVIKDNAIARGQPQAIFRTLSFPAPTFDGLMENPEARDQLKEMGISMDEARRRYNEEAPKTMQLVKELPPRDTSQAPDQAGEETTPPTIKVPGRLQPRQGELKPVIKDATRGAVTKAPVINDGARQTLQRRALDRVSPALAIARGDREIPEGPMAVEEFMDHIMRVARDADGPKVALRSINTDGPFKANVFEMTRAASQGALKMPGAAGLSAEDMKERNEHAQEENEAGGQ